MIHAAEAELIRNPKIAESAWDMMNCLEIAYHNIRDRRVENEILRPRLLPPDFVRWEKIDPGILLDANQALRDFKMPCDLLVCGFDRDGEPHVFLVMDPGTARPYDTLGFHAIGIGSDAALGRLLWRGTDRADDLEKVLYDAFEAKAIAEIISGVGYEWDAQILVHNKPALAVPERTKRIIDQLFGTHNTTPFDNTIDEDDTPPRNWKSHLKQLAERALGTETPPTTKKV